MRKRKKCVKWLASWETWESSTSVEKKKKKREFGLRDGRWKATSYLMSNTTELIWVLTRWEKRRQGKTSADEPSPKPLGIDQLDRWQRLEISAFESEKERLTKNLQPLSLIEVSNCAKLFSFSFFYLFLLCVNWRDHVNFFSSKHYIDTQASVSQACPCY